MYEFIKGEIAALTPAVAVIETPGGVGYSLSISLQTYAAVGSAKSVKLYTHFVVREDVQQLFGFYDPAERELFRLLIGVSGVGGNTARMILSSFRADELQVIIATGKADVLKSVKGLGLKTSQKIIVELKDKVVPLGGTDTAAYVPGLGTSGALVDEALAALTMLGFSKASSEKTLREILQENPSASVEELVRVALKKL